MDGGGGFWIFIAALVVGGIWSDARKKAEKHETLRWIVEKTGTIDEAKFKDLFREESAEGKPGYAYRGLRITGMIILFLGMAGAAGIAIAISLGKLFNVTAMFTDPAGWIAGLAISAGVAVLGLGFFYSSRFATPPPDLGIEPPAR